VQARAPREDFKHQQIQGAVERIGFGHTKTS
jgi:hypothetical protein